MSASRPVTTALVVLAIASLAGCEREQRRFESPPTSVGVAGKEQMGSIHAGPTASMPTPSNTSAMPTPSHTPSAPPSEAPPYERNAYLVAQGKRLFRWYNCNGCHANGGGDSGPALMDDRWIYGHEPEQIVATIREGRPNGMPSFAGRIPEDEARQIAAYIVSMSGQLRTDVAPSRADALSPGEPEQRREFEPPTRANPRPPSR